MKQPNKYNKYSKLDVNNQQNQNLEDPFALLDEKPEVHTPESIQERCKKLVKDAAGVIPALRIVGIADMKDPWGLQVAENELCNQMLSFVSGRCGMGATDNFARAAERKQNLSRQNDERPTMDELDSEKDDILG